MMLTDGNRNAPPSWIPASRVGSPCRSTSSRRWDCNGKKSGTAILADGSQVFFDVYEASIVWDGQVLATSVDESDSEPLIGMALMSGFRILIDDVDGGPVSIERI